jgi:glutathionyl-hydroquinone reductase
MKEENWDARIDMIYERHYKCYTYRYIVRYDNKTIFKKDFYNYDEEKLNKILKKIQKQKER